MFKPFLYGTVVVLVLFSAGMWRLSDGFSIAKMSAPLPYDSRWEVDSPSVTYVTHLLSQPYYYIGKGSQCYVFESADKQYVLKFFRLARYRLPPFQEALPLPPFLAAIQNKQSRAKRIKQEGLFASCTLAYKELQEECGLLYLHLNKTTHLKQEVIIYDNLKRPHTLPIDKYAFLIQKKGEQLYPYLGRLLKEGKNEEVKKAVASIANLLNRRASKGIADSDAEIHKNTGFGNGKAFFLDTGQFCKAKQVEDQGRVMRKLLLWLEAKDAALASEVAPTIELSHGAYRRSS